MKYFLLVMLSCCSAAFAFSQAEYREEFNGPFASWANVKTRFHAAGDGVTDDTRALQNAIDSLSLTLKGSFNTNPATGYVVVYLPAGTYRISETLRLEGRLGVSFIGEDPEKTIIRWDGGDNDTMFFSNKSAYIKISRLTWDANNKSKITAVGLHFRDKNNVYFFPTTIELSDMIFTGKLYYGLSTGTYPTDGVGQMDSEFTIKRCRFYDCVGAGIRIKGYNSLDNWIWDCVFENCNLGIHCSHGNYHVYNSRFSNSTTADLRNADPKYLSVRGSYSENSKAFSIDDGASTNPFKRTFQGNIVRNSTDIPIQYHHRGRITLLDNRFTNEGKAPKHTLDFSSFSKGNYDVLSIDNHYAQDQPVNTRKDSPVKIHSIEDLKQQRLVTKAPEPISVQPFVPFRERKIFEVPAGAGSATIQQIVNEAAALTGQRPVVHFPMGTYPVEETITIPAGSDMQLVGDGMIRSSILIKKGNPDNFYYFNIEGPSFITIRDLQIGIDGKIYKPNAFLFTGIDQPSSQVMLDQIYSKAVSTLLIDKLDYTYFEKNNSFFSNGHTIVGGKRVKAGKGTSKLFCFGGQSAGVRLKNNATMVAKDCWWEGALKKDFLPLDLTGDGNLTVDGAMYAPKDQDSGTLVRVNDFRGKISLLNMYMIGSIDVQPGSPDLEMLIWNINQYHKKDPFQFLERGSMSKIAMMGISAQCFKRTDKSCLIEQPQSFSDRIVNVPNLNAFLTKMTRDDRDAKPRPYCNLAKGVSNIYVSRVCVYTGETAFTFRK